MSSLLSASTRSSRHGRTNSQLTRNSQDTDTNTPNDYLGDNLLAGAFNDTGHPGTSFATRNILVNSEGSTASGLGYTDRTTTSGLGHTDNTRLVIAIDYGTTFTGVAFALTTTDIADLSDIEIVMDWGKAMNSAHKVPSVNSYSSAPNGERQWGADLSPEAIINKNMKLQLDVQRRRIDGLELTLEILEGTGNLSIDHVKRSNRDSAYAYRPPTTIVTDYLTKVFERAWEIIGPRYAVYGTKKPPVDIVVTVPVGWSYQATNATLRALRHAGFNEMSIPTLNDMILLTEPEAASHFTVRHIQEQSPRFLKLNEPFILVDAGGGTVDVISYQVKQLTPHLELVQVSEPTSDKCGAAYIDTYFKRWLHKLIGEERYSKLDPSYSGHRIGAHTTESSEMRQLIQQFDRRKKVFSNNSITTGLYLPESLWSLEIPGVIEKRELILQPGDMRTMFNGCVNKIIPLIKDQKRMVENQCNRRVKNLLLVGGFGESPFLQEELEKGLNMRDIHMRHPGQMASWTAVVQGGVIYGIERVHHKNLRVMKTSLKSYGIVLDEIASYMYDEDDWYTHPLTNTTMARGQFSWLVRRGDVVLSERTEVAEKEFTRTFKAADGRKFDMTIYMYQDEDDDVPPRWQTGQYEVEAVGTVRCDITPVPRGNLQSRKNYETGESYVLAYLTCKMRTSFNSLEVEVLVDETSVGRTTITIGSEEPRAQREPRLLRRGSISSLDS